MSTRLRRHWPFVLVVAATSAAMGAGLAGGTPAEPRAEGPHREDKAQHPRAHTVRDANAARENPLSFARVAFIKLHGYDTRSDRDDWRRDLLATLGTPESSLGARDVDRLIPDAAQWAQMAAVGQRASATVDSVYVPAVWHETVAEYPQLPDGVAAVTVTGTQSVSWDGGTSRVPVAVTLLLVCPPATERCVVSRITAQVAR